MPDVLKSGLIGEGGHVREVKWAAVNATAAGDTTVVSAVTGKKIRVFGLTFTASNQVNVAWKSGSNVLINACPFAQYGGMDCNRHPGWYMETNAGEALIINLSGAVNVRGSLNYIEV